MLPWSIRGAHRPPATCAAGFGRRISTPFGLIAPNATATKTAPRAATILLLVRFARRKSEPRPLRCRFSKAKKHFSPLSPLLKHFPPFFTIEFPLSWQKRSKFSGVKTQQSCGGYPASPHFIVKKWDKNNSGCFESLTGSGFQDSVKRKFPPVETIQLIDCKEKKSF